MAASIIIILKYKATSMSHKKHHL